MEAKKYRKKPVIIEAMQFDGSDSSGYGILRWVGAGSRTWERDNHHIMIPTLEGIMRADVGDYIIKGIQGEFYPCKPDIFAASYDELTAITGE